MEMIIGWTLIIILAFLIIRTQLAGRLLYPLAEAYVKKLKELKIRKTIEFRNFYLFVFNPFLWTPYQVLLKEADRREFKKIVKTSKKIFENLERKQ